MAFLMKSVLSKVQVHVPKPALKTVKTMKNAFQGPGIDSRSQGSWYLEYFVGKKVVLWSKLLSLLRGKVNMQILQKKTQCLIGLAARLVSRWTMRRAGQNAWWPFNLCFFFGCTLPETNLASENGWLGRPIFRAYVSFREGNPTNLKLDHHVSHHSRSAAAPPTTTTAQLAKDLFGVPAGFFVAATQQIVSCPPWFRVLMMFRDGRLFKGQSSITSSTLCTIILPEL